MTSPEQPVFDNDQLMMIVKSLSITYSALNEKLDRVTGRHYDEALEDFRVCDSALTVARSAASARRLSEAS